LRETFNIDPSSNAVVLVNFEAIQENTGFLKRGDVVKNTAIFKSTISNDIIVNNI